MKRRSLYLLVILVLVSAAIVGVVWFRGNPDALWQIVSQQCVPHQQQHGDPAPCLTVQLAERYVLFKDQKGPYHDLLMPTDKISGIESPQLLRADSPNYFALAWQNRHHLVSETGNAVRDDWLSLAVNSHSGRSQNQLHIHIACLRPDVYQALREQYSQIDTRWRPLEHTLRGHRYLARKLDSTDLRQADPFKTLYQYVVQQQDEMARYGLALVMAPDGTPVLLAGRRAISELYLGSAGEIQDYQCTLAREQPAEAVR